MKKYLPYIKNRYFISTAIAVVYILVLHNTDIYTLIKRQNKVAQLESEINRQKEEIEKMRENLQGLDNIRSLEKYARENYLFKKDDEEIFVFSFE